MSADANRIRARLDTLGDSLDDLEAIIEPLLAQTLPETVVGLETIQQAKLQVVLPYLVYDLIFSASYTRPVRFELQFIQFMIQYISNQRALTRKHTLSCLN